MKNRTTVYFMVWRKKVYSFNEEQWQRQLFANKIIKELTKEK